MADNFAKPANMARVLAIVHLIVGFLLVCFGIADRIVEELWTGYIYFGIWIGIWMLFTGSLGIPGTRKEPSTSRNAFAGVFMGFSITSAVLGGLIIICYSISIAMQRPYNRRYYESLRYRNYDEEMAISAIILILGIIEFAIGIWAAVCVCLMNICYFSTPPQQGQVMYTANSGYFMTQGLAGVPVAVLMQSSGGAQEGQSQMVPVSGTGGNQPQLVQVAPYGTMASGCQPQRIDMPLSYEEGQYATQQNQQASSGVPVAIPMQAGVGIVADQTIIPEVQENELQIVLLPDSREMDNPPPPYEDMASRYQTLQVDMPPSYEEAEHGEWKSYV